MAERKPGPYDPGVLMRQLANVVERESDCGPIRAREVAEEIIDICDCAAWPAPQPITDAQKTGESFLLWDPQWKLWDKGHWSEVSGKGRWYFAKDYAEENEITHYLPLPPDVKP